MAQDERPIEFTLADWFGNELLFKNSREIREFIKAEMDAWHWLQHAPHDPVNLHAGYLNTYSQIITIIDRLDRGEAETQSVINDLRSFYSGERPNLVISDFWPGTAVLAIREKLGDGSAEKALGILTGKKAFDVSNLPDFALYQMLAVPSLIGPEAWLKEHRQKIGQARSTLWRQLAKQTSEAADALEASALQNIAQRKHYRRLAARVVRGAFQKSEAYKKTATEKLTEMDNTRAAYDEQMALEAPVRYWRKKKASHAASAEKWAGGLVVYSVAAIILAWLMFSRLWEALGAEEALTGRHFIMVTGIGAALTVIFWGARLCIRIYLAERHLANDAEERWVMTQAYLALIKKAAASNEERIVILSTLFRAGSDGIVKDDGGADIGLPAMVARLLEARR